MRIITERLSSAIAEDQRCVQGCLIEPQIFASPH